MNVIYSENYNFNLGLLNYLHPFDGTKFKKIYDNLKLNQAIHFIEPLEEINMAMIDDFLSTIMRKKIRDKVFVLRALEVPNIPLVSFSYLDKRILSPMRWAVAGTILAAQKALKNASVYWNVSGGYHHAMQQNMEGFCIYNDIGICYQRLIHHNLLDVDDKIVIIDTDAHHGNGNAYTFMENKQCTLLDIYNVGIYPTSAYTRERVNFSVPLKPSTQGQTYLQQYSEALDKLDDDYRIAFVVAGTDTLVNDKLGGLCLTIDDVIEREKLTLEALHKRSIPTVVLGGGGYSKDSAESVIHAISACSTLDMTSRVSEVQSLSQ
ncbi:MAG: histone deacetylase [Pseudomonadota bacterium]